MEAAEDITMYIYFIVITIIGCCGSGYLGYLDNEFNNQSFHNKHDYIKKNVIKYTIGYVLVFISIVLLIFYCIELVNIS